MCGCKDRRAAIVSGAQAAMRGDAATAAAKAGFVARTAAQDARAAGAALARRISTIRRPGR